MKIDSNTPEHIAHKADTTSSDTKLKQSPENTLTAAGFLFVIMAIILSLISWSIAIGIGISFIITFIYVIMMSGVFDHKFQLKFSTSSPSHTDYVDFNNQERRISDYEPKTSDNFNRTPLYDPFSDRKYDTSVNPTTGLPMVGGVGGRDCAGNPFGAKLL